VIDIFCWVELLMLLFCCTSKAPFACLKAPSVIELPPDTLLPAALLPFTLLVRLAVALTWPAPPPGLEMGSMSMFWPVELLMLRFCCTWTAPLACLNA